jgi:hypothetical protein
MAPKRILLTAVQNQRTLDRTDLLGEEEETLGVLLLLLPPMLEGSPPSQHTMHRGALQI